MRDLATGVCLFALSTVVVPGAQAQIVLPSQQHETLEVNLFSLNDEVTLYMGDPQELLHMRYRPDDVEPRVEYASQARAVLRILDSYLFEESPLGPSTMPEEGRKKDQPDRQTWEVRISPAGPTQFSLRVEGGKGTFDFTDFQVQQVDIQGEGSRFDVAFERSNPIVLESFRAHARRGSFAFHDLLNARAKEVVLFLPGSACRVEIQGDEFEGESAVLLQGPPESTRLVISRKVGLRVKGPAATIARFQSKHMTQSGEEWVSRNYDEARCRVQLTIAEEFPALEVRWD
jgi:hypothetical protein